MKNTSIVTTGIILIGMTLQSEAALIKADLSPGDRQLTFDSDTGLSWLNIPNTTGLSYNAMMSQLAGSGFRYATSDEVGTLLAHYGVAQLPAGTYTYGGSYNEITSLMTDFLGVTWANYNSRAIVGITADPSPVAQTHQFAYLYSNDYGQWCANQYWSYVNNDYAGYPVTGWEVSSFLVKDRVVAVPEPSTYITGVSILMLGLFGWRNRK